MKQQFTGFIPLAIVAALAAFSAWAGRNALLRRVQTKFDWHDFVQ